MLNKTIDMRVEAATLAAEGKQLRTEAKRMLKKARRNMFDAVEKTDRNGVTYTKRYRTQDTKRTARASLAYHQYNNIYRERMAVRQEARLHHLARMLLKGQPYSLVEQFTHHKVDAGELYERVWQWDPSITEEFVEAWLERDVA